MNRISFAGIAFAVLILLGGGIGGCVACLKYERVQPGFVGVSVKKCNGGGVADKPITSGEGIYWRELFCEDVVMYPISMQSLILTKNHHEGKGGADGAENDQSVTITSNEGLSIEVDVALNFTLNPALVPKIYEKWRSDIDNISHLYIRQTIREGFQTTFSKYTAEQLYSDKKEIARAEIEKFLHDKLTPMGFDISQFTINRIEPPKQVIEAINAKVVTTQQTQQSKQEVIKKQAEAEQAVAVAKGQADAVKAQAEGEAESIRLRADAQAKANRLLAESITPQLIEYEKMRKWNGVLPTYTGGGTPLIQMK